MGSDRRLGFHGAFESARADGRAALMPYMMGGFPDAETATSVAAAYVQGGADMIELGIPYSDPLADGPVIHAAGTRALEGGATFDSVLGLGADAAQATPIAFMVYANMVLARGPRELAARLDADGIAGVIVPDLSFEESAGIRAPLEEREIALIPLVAPTTPAERRKRICEAASGFVYVVSLVGVTGERGELPPGLEELVASAREESRVPVAVGFGIGTPEQAARVGQVADGVIIGSRLVREVGEASGAEDAAARVRGFLEACREAMASVR
jgi:tryptophan synthase alpha chain